MTDLFSPSAEYPAVLDAVEASQRSARDLAAIFALPAMWIDHEPDAIVADLLAVLVSLLRLQSAYVRFDAGRGGPLEQWHPAGPSMPGELREMMPGAQLDDGVFQSAPGGAISIASVSPTIPGASGYVLAGSPRPDFPTAAELHLLQAATGQALISIRAARRLAEERAARLSAEAALRDRNAYLVTLARDLESPLAALAEHAARTRGLADRPAAPFMAVPNDCSGPGPVANPEGDPLARLTRRETEVLGLLAQGWSNKEIAGILSLSDRTVERHITGLYRKIQVERRSEATAFALHHGLANTKLIH